jgi:hypothetical protein
MPGRRTPLPPRCGTHQRTAVRRIAEQTVDALFSTSIEGSMNKESDLGIGWRRPFLYMYIYHIPIDLEGRLYRQGQRTTNTRPFPKSAMLFITGYLAKTHESLPSGEAHLCTS